MRSGRRDLALALALLPALLPLGAACAPAQREPTTPPATEPRAPEAAAPQGPAREQSPEQRAAETEEARAQAAVVAAIEQAVNQTRAAVHDCWARAAADDYRLAGRVTLRVQFDRASEPPAVTAGDDEPGDPVLTRCLVAVYQAHAWPAELAATTIEIPFAFEAPDQQYTVRAEDVPSVPLIGPFQARTLLHTNNTGNPAVSLVLATMKPSPDAPFVSWEAPADDLTRLFYVIEGAAKLATERGGKAVRLAAGQAVVVPPGMSYALRFAPNAPLTMVEIAVPGSGVVGLVLGAPTEGATPARRDRRKARLPAVQTRPQVFPIAGGQAEIAIFYDRAGGLAAASLGVITARPGMRIPAHVHERETEMVLILEGTGTMTIDGETHRIAPMTAIQIPPGVEHAVLFDGDGPVRALQVYTPSGPEQRFKQPPTP
jgi:mannose-6-phosphate isomerase-like protein (cupin superfamily)